MGNDVTETQLTTQPNVQQTDLVYLQAECRPSLKEKVKAKSIASGFKTLTECLLTLARDFCAGRIQYSEGILVSQEKNSLN